MGAAGNHFPVRTCFDVTRYARLELWQHQLSTDKKVAMPVLVLKPDAILVYRRANDAENVIFSVYVLA